MKTATDRNRSMAENERGKDESGQMKKLRRIEGACEMTRQVKDFVGSRQEGTDRERMSLTS